MTASLWYCKQCDFTFVPYDVLEEFTCMNCGKPCEKTNQKDDQK